MDDSEGAWRVVDSYLADRLVGEDDILRDALDVARGAGLPAIEVSASQGKLLWLLCRMIGARRVLEFGTLAGYSTIWLARGVGDNGWVVTLEIDPAHARVARGCIERAGVSARVEVLEGDAVVTAERLVEEGAEPFDLVFVDADKPNNPRYLAAALALSRPGTVLVVDNVVRGGRVVDEESADPSVQGTRRMIDLIAEDPRLDATAVQTVGIKGWDGFLLARVR